MKRIIAGLAVAALAFAAACSEMPTETLTDTSSVIPSFAASFGTPQPSYPVSFRGITPTEYLGNFVSSDDDQVCYDLSELEYIEEVTGDMRGFKVNDAIGFSNSWIEVIISVDKRYLAWETTNAAMVGFVVKGGPNYHVYDYVGTTFSTDSWLASPRNNAGRIPQVSHYNVCYIPEGGDGEGCTPGYWRNHADRWLGVAPDDYFDTVFGVTSGLGASYRLGQAIWAQGGGVHALARHATAALLNAYGGVPNGDGTRVDFPLTPTQVIALVQAAFGPDGDLEGTKDYLDGLNNAGCPLGGTRAVKVR
jgi:hypothetical protein